MILFDNIVQVLALTNLNALVFISVVLFDSGSNGAALVDIYQAGFTVGADRLVEKSPGRLLITVHSEQEIDCLALLVDGAIEIFPIAFDFDIGLIKPPAIPSPFLVFPKGLLDARCVMDDPAVNLKFRWTRTPPQSSLRESINRAILNHTLTPEWKDTVFRYTASEI